MPSPEQLAELQNPAILEAFLSDVKTSEIQSKLDAIRDVDCKTEMSKFTKRLADMHRGVAIKL